MNNAEKTGKAIILQVLTLMVLGMIYFVQQNPDIYSNSLGLISKNWQNENGDRKLVDQPFERFTNRNYIQWDAEHYDLIKNYGYSTEKSGGDYIFAFFPLFPLIWRLSFLPPAGILFLNYIFFSVSVLILLKILSKSKDFIQNVLISLCMPGIIIFLIPYTEATYMLMVTFAIYGFVKDKYWLFFTGFFLAALTRPSYTFLFLSVIGAELFYLIQHRNFRIFFKNSLLRTLPLITGTFIVSLVQYIQKSGGVFKFIEVQKYWNNTFSVPHQLRDWSHEGFAINIGVVFFLFTPLLVILAILLYNQFIRKKALRKFSYQSNKDYLLNTICIRLMS